MGHLFDFFLVLFFLLFSWWVFHFALHHFIIQFVTVALSLLICTLTSSLLGVLLQKIFSNVLIYFTLLTAISILIYFLLKRFANNFVKSKSWDEKLVEKFCRNKVLKSISGAFFYTMTFTLLFGICDFLLSLFSLSPMADPLHQNSFVIQQYYQVIERSNVEENKNELNDMTEGPDATEVSEKLVKGMGDLFRSARGAFAKATGTEELTKNIKLISRINELSLEQKTHLIETMPEIKKLTSNKTIHEILHNPILLGQIENAALGDIGSLYSLGENEMIKNLMSDNDIKAALQNISLEKIIKQIELNTLASFEKDYLFDRLYVEEFDDLLGVLEKVKRLNNSSVLNVQQLRTGYQVKKKYLLMGLDIEATKKWELCLILPNDGNCFYYLDGKRLLELDQKKMAVIDLKKEGIYHLAILLENQENVITDLKIKYREK